MNKYPKIINVNTCRHNFHLYYSSCPKDPTFEKSIPIWRFIIICTKCGLLRDVKIVNEQFIGYLKSLPNITDDELKKLTTQV